MTGSSSKSQITFGDYQVDGNKMKDSYTGPYNDPPS